MPSMYSLSRQIEECINKQLKDTERDRTQLGIKKFSNYSALGSAISDAARPKLGEHAPSALCRQYDPPNGDIHWRTRIIRLHQKDGPPVALVSLDLETFFAPHDHRADSLHLTRLPCSFASDSKPMGKFLCI